MSTVEFGLALVGFVIVVVTVWQIARNGIAESNGNIPEKDNSWFGPN